MVRTEREGTDRPAVTTGGGEIRRGREEDGKYGWGRSSDRGLFRVRWVPRVSANAPLD
jgi:hypothetical protein